QVVRQGDLLLIAGAGSIRMAAPRLVRPAGSSRTSLRLSTVAQAEAETSRESGVTNDANSQTVIALFREQVRRNPVGHALADDERVVSYRELEELSNALADVLCARGASAGVPVGVRLPPSIDLVVAMLAIMKARAVYLPIDQALPGDRVSYML